jgi:hypothetical protein
MYVDRPAKNHVHHAEKELDLVLLHAYYATRAIALLFQSQGLLTLDEKELATTLHHVKEHLYKIQQPVFRVSVLENIFKLLFLETGSITTLHSQLLFYYLCNKLVLIYSSSSLSEHWKEQNRPSHTEYSKYMLSSRLLASLLSLVLDSVADVHQEITHSPTLSVDEVWGAELHPVILPNVLTSLCQISDYICHEIQFDPHAQSLLRRVERLKTYTEEARWRLNILEAAAAGLGPTWRPEFVHNMLATPVSLLNMCLHHSYYNLAKDVTEFFAMERRVYIPPLSLVSFNQFKMVSIETTFIFVRKCAQIVEIAEALDGVSDEMQRKGGQEGCIVANAMLGGHLTTLRGYDAFILFFDLALCASPTPEHCSGFVTTAQHYLGRFAILMMLLFEIALSIEAVAYNVFFC